MSVKRYFIYINRVMGQLLYIKCVTLYYIILTKFITSEGYLGASVFPDGRGVGVKDLGHAKEIIHILMWGRGWVKKQATCVFIGK